MSVDAQATQKPGIVDVKDLRHPVLTPLQQATKEGAEGYPVNFDEAEIMAAACKATGLDDFGADNFRVRLRLWLSSLDADKNLSALGRVALYQAILRFLSYRLRVEDMIKRHPEILDIKIDRPIVIAGLPRSGTTYLQNFIGADPRLRVLPHWEAFRPLPEPGDGPGVAGEQRRRALAAADWAQQDALLPELKAIHDFEPDHISEDLELMALDFGSYYCEWLALVPAWRDYYFSHDQTESYQYLKRVLQVLTFLKGPNRWLLKCPQHMEMLIPLTNVFPDATVVCNQRDPSASVQSAIVGVCNAARLTRKGAEPDIDTIADYWIDRYERLLRAFVRDRPKLDDAHTQDVYFHELMADPWKVVEAIYEKADLPLTEEVRQQMRDFVAAHPRDKHGKFVYDMNRDFGISPESLREKYKFYFDAFPVQKEIK